MNQEPTLPPSSAAADAPTGELLRSLLREAIEYLIDSHPNGDSEFIRTCRAALAGEAATQPAAQSPEGWKSMRTAPKDGTAVLALLDGSDIPHAVRWDKDESCWRITWDGDTVSTADGPRYWMHCPADPDKE